MDDMALNLLLREIATLEEERENALDAMRLQQRKIRRIEVQLEPLKKIAEQVQAHKGVNGAPASLLAPSEAVMQYLAKHPGSELRDLIDGVLPTISTSSANPRKLMYSIIGQLEESGRIIRDSNTKLFRIADNVKYGGS